MSKDLPDLVFRHQEDESPAWYCATCGEIVHEQVDGASVLWVVKAQKEHVCQHVLAKKRLPADRDRLRALLGALGPSGVRIEIMWTDHESAELMLVDNKTRAELPLGSESLG